MEVLPRLALRRADLVFCSSEFTRRRVMQRHGVRPDKAKTIHPPVSRSGLDRAARVICSPGNASPVILSVGRVTRGSEYKGYDQVIRALPLIRDRVPDVRYVVVGGGDALPDLARLSADMGVADRVEFRGPVADDALWDAFEEARVFALPSKMDPSQASPQGEGFGIVYAEAAAFGRPVVGSTMGGAAEAVEHGVTGCNVDPTKPEAVAAALLTYLEQPARADRDGAAGRDRVLRSLTPERFATNLIVALRQAGLMFKECEQAESDASPDA
jgi:phosphatidylinositol alpha-1,6-mannosyltransferase